jgi:hypothetical protein
LAPPQRAAQFRLSVCQKAQCRHKIVLKRAAACCRIQNFQLAVKHAPAVWKAHNARTEVYIKMAEKRLADVKAEITKVNQRRKLRQEKAKVTLDRLTKEYNDLVKRNIELVLACKKLEIQNEREAAAREAEKAAAAADAETADAETVAAEPNVDADEPSADAAAERAKDNAEASVDAEEKQDSAMEH